jgi:hypothetical protein
VKPRVVDNRLRKTRSDKKNMAAHPNLYLDTRCYVKVRVTQTAFTDLSIVLQPVRVNQTCNNGTDCIWYFLYANLKHVIAEGHGFNPTWPSLHMECCVISVYTYAWGFYERHELLYNG